MPASRSTSSTSGLSQATFRHEQLSWKSGRCEKTTQGPGAFDSTYTIAYYTPNLDLPHWSLVNLPGLSGRNVDLRYFWRDHAFAIEVYALKRGAMTHGEAQKDHIAELVVSPDASRAVDGVKEVDSALVLLAVSWPHGALGLGQAPRSPQAKPASKEKVQVGAKLS